MNKAVMFSNIILTPFYIFYLALLKRVSSIIEYYIIGILTLMMPGLSSTGIIWGIILMWINYNINELLQTISSLTTFVICQESYSQDEITWTTRQCCYLTAVYRGLWGNLVYVTGLQDRSGSQKRADNGKVIWLILKRRKATRHLAERLIITQ